MAILSKYKLEKYQYGTDVRKGRQLYGLSGKIIYDGKWISRRADKIIIVEMNAAIAEREANFYLEVNGHQNIIQTLGLVENSLNLTIFIQEFAEHNDLAGVLMDNQFNISQTILIEMFLQIADAMSYVASKNIVHGDLGCRNVLVFRVDPAEPKNNLVKITDFGLARWIEHPPANEDPTIIPIRYCAPEILRHNRHASYSQKSDVYSMGVLIWEALSNSEIPYSSIAEDDDVKQKKLNNERLPQPQVCDRQLWVLMNNCWHKNREKRPTFELIKENLSNIEVSDGTNLRSSVSLYEPPENYEYELNVDVRMAGLLNGHFGKTYEAEWILRAERPIVLVMMEQEPGEYEAKVYNDFDRHPHILYTFGFVENNQGLPLLLQERAPYNNLQTLLNSGEFQPQEKVLITIFLQIVDAMSYVASQGIVHGDLRCGNILVFEMNPSEPTKNLVKLANFTLAHRNDPSFVDDRRLVVPVRYCALEILRSAGRSNYSEFSDVYSIGVLMWEAYSQGKLPYESSRTNGEVRQRKLNGEKLPRPLICDNQMWSIMEDCWLNEPQLRYEFKDMKTRLSNINLDSIKTYQYELNKNIKQKRLLSDSSGKFYEADWIPKKDPPILLLVIDRPAAEHEALFYMKLNSHPHIIHTFGLVKNDRQSIMLLQERALHGNLQTLLQSENFQPSSEVLVAIFLQIVDAMIYVTKQGIVHGDLRCANILVFQMDSFEPLGNLVKLTNFSLARTKDQTFAENNLPHSLVRYCAPEILRSEDGSNYSEASDVYSMGMLMYEACSEGEVPYGRRTSDRDVLQQRLNNAKLLQPKKCHSQIWCVIEDYCCLNEPDLRLTFEELKVQLGKVDLNIIDREHCSRCNKDIPKNEMDKHLKRCSRKRSIDDPPAPPVHFTRCKYCGERCLGSELEGHQQSCPSRFPPDTHFRPILFVRCDYCGQEIRSEDITNHQESCPSRATPPLGPETFRFIRCRYCEEEYLDSEIADHTQSCLSRPKTPVPQKRCIHCNVQYLLAEIDRHEKICLSRPITPPPLVPIRSQECKYCHREYPSTNIENHERSCPSIPVPLISRPSTPVLIQCRYCYQQYSQNNIGTHENACLSKPKSCTDRLLSWLCSCCAKD